MNGQGFTLEELQAKTGKLQQEADSQAEAERDLRWAEHIAQGLQLSREAMLGDLNGENGEEFAASTKQVLRAYESMYKKAIGAPGPLDLHSTMGEMHAVMAEAWQSKEPEPSDFVKHGQSIAIHGIPCLAMLASLIVPGYELRLVKVEQPAEQPTEEPAAASA